MAKDDKLSLFRRFSMFLERALGSSDRPGSYHSERFRADMYNSTDGGG